MAITKIQSNAFPATIDLSGVDLTIGTGEIATTNLADSAVSSAKLASAVITPDKLADSAVHTSKLASSSITTPKIADNAIHTAKIAATAVTHDKLHTDMNLTSKTVVLPDMPAFNFTSGNVGIGTDSANTPLEVVGTITATSYIGDGSSLTGINTDLVSDTTPQLGGNLDLNSSNITGTGNVNITGTVTATSFSGDGSSLTGIESLPDAISVDGSAPSSSLSIDASGNSTVTGNIVVTGTVDGRDVAADGSKLDGIESGATADQTASEILTAIKTVDGASSGLDADTVDGLQAASFVQKSGDTLTGTLNYRMLSSQTTSNLDTAGDNSGFSVFYGTTSATSKPSGTDHAVVTFSYSSDWQTQMAMDWRTKDMYFRTQENTSWKSWAKMWHSDNDGSGSGLDADLLDGVQLSGIVQRDFQDTNRNLNIATNSTSSAGLFMKASDGGFRFQIYGDGTNYGFLDGDWAAWDLKKTTNGALYFNDNNSYYLNPPATTKLNTVYANDRYYFRGDVTANHEAGLYFHGGSDKNYAIYREAGAWSHPYPDLRIDFHTGIKIGANSGYNGTRFYNDSVNNGGTEIFSVGNGDNHVRVQNYLYAPIFYDLNDTAYYANPNDYSRFKSVQAGNQGALNANTTYAMGLYHNSRYLLGFRYSAADTNYPWLVHDTWNGAAFIVHFNGIGDRLWLSEGGILQSYQDMRAPIFYDSNNTAYYFDGHATGDSIRVAGDIVAYYSDARLKDFHGRIDNALDKVLKINGYYYTENETAKALGYNTGKMQVGVSAQEVEEVLPEVIKDAPIGHGYKTVQYERMIPLLLEAIKELKEENDELKARLDAAGI